MSRGPLAPTAIDSKKSAFHTLLSKRNNGFQLSVSHLSSSSKSILTQIILNNCKTFWKPRQQISERQNWSPATYMAPRRATRLTQHSKFSSPLLKQPSAETTPLCPPTGSFLAPPSLPSHPSQTPRGQAHWRGLPRASLRCHGSAREARHCHFPLASPPSLHAMPPAAQRCLCLPGPHSGTAPAPQHSTHLTDSVRLGAKQHVFSQGPSGSLLLSWAGVTVRKNCFYPETSTTPLSSSSPLIYFLVRSFPYHSPSMMDASNDTLFSPLLVQSGILEFHFLTFLKRHH